MQKFWNFIKPSNWTFFFGKFVSKLSNLFHVVAGWRRKLMFKGVILLVKRTPKMLKVISVTLGVLMQISNQNFLLGRLKNFRRNFGISSNHVIELFSLVKLFQNCHISFMLSLGWRRHLMFKRVILLANSTTKLLKVISVTLGHCKYPLILLGSLKICCGKFWISSNH